MESAANKPERSPAADDTAWETLERALEDLLDVTRRRGGYSPRVFVARMRAKAALRRGEPLEQASSAVDRHAPGSG